MRYIFLLLLYSVLFFIPGYAQESVQLYQGITRQLQLSDILEDKAAKCGFPIVLAAYVSQDPDVLREIQFYKQQVEQESYQVYQSPSGHFLINYKTEGFDAIPSYDRNNNGTPDYLEFVANAFDRAWRIEIDSLGFKPPPDEQGNPVETYNIYCKRLPTNQYGSTLFDINQDIAALPGKNYTSHIEINTAFTNAPYSVSDPIVRDSMAIAVTAAHEFNHAIQLGYHIRYDENNDSRNFPDLWFIESSATYMEEVVANEVNDYYQFLPYFFKATDRSLVDGAFSSASLDRIYGETILFIMMEKFYGPSVTRRIWEKIVNYKAVDALDAFLRENGSDLSQILQQLAGWMFFTGSQSFPEKYFPEGGQYPEVPIAVTTPYNGKFQKMARGELEPLSFRYFSSWISDAKQPEIYLHHLNGNEVWQGAIFDRQAGNFQTFLDFVHTPIDFFQAPAQLNFAVVHGMSDANIGFDAAQPDSFTVYLEDAASPGYTQPVSVYPNIIRPDEPPQKVIFTGLPKNGKVVILTSNGQLVKEIVDQQRPGIMLWDLTNQDGRPVGSGVYIYRVLGAGVKQQNKLIVIR